MRLGIFFVIEEGTEAARITKVVGSSVVFQIAWSDSLECGIERGPPTPVELARPAIESGSLVFST